MSVGVRVEAHGGGLAIIECSESGASLASVVGGPGRLSANRVGKLDLNMSRLDFLHCQGKVNFHVPRSARAQSVIARQKLCRHGLWRRFREHGCRAPLRVHTQARIRNALTGLVLDGERDVLGVCLLQVEVLGNRLAVNQLQRLDR